MALLRFVWLSFLLADLIGFIFSSAFVNLNNGREIFLDYSNGKKMGHGYLMVTLMKNLQSILRHKQEKSG